MAEMGDLRVTGSVTLPEAELEEQFIRASGPGGQNVNKVSSAVQLRYLAAQSSAISSDVKRRLYRLAGQRATKDGDVLIEASRFRSQERNREDARERLAELLREAVKPPPPPRKKTRPSKGAVERRIKAKKGRSRIKAMRRSVDD
ncbi:alternative ribosome rescue aminoacyl-tRNA hydrolase ArfB [Jiella mangrovi]|uniref:Aminoacyl-tRNA hydrolase n=1 Tax=Jiella mangrovi TaxID=2821407 RepID=A0ABS4BFL1_9HYPH|nr:alternative ribosome rescue aminoacyl-tRNA hydrolase ArfB [Jiella mangrovi]MBP0615554.1 aminoacyl-tRNA hydrolase [Jiella mangrovi]